MPCLISLHCKWLLKNRAHLQFFIWCICMCWVFTITCLSFGVPDLLLQVDSRSYSAIGHLLGLSKAQNIHRQRPQQPWAAGSRGKLAERLWYGQPEGHGHPHAGGLCNQWVKQSWWILWKLHSPTVRGSCSWGKNSKGWGKGTTDVFLLGQDSGDWWNILTYICCAWVQFPMSRFMISGRSWLLRMRMQVRNKLRPQRKQNAEKPFIQISSQILVSTRIT